MKPEDLEGLRSCCRDDVAFEQLLQLLGLESDQRTGSFRVGPEAAALEGRRGRGSKGDDRALGVPLWQEGAQRFQALIENATDIIVILDEQGTFCYCSPSAERILGYTLADVWGRNAVELVHADDAPLILQVLQGAILQPRQSQPPIEYRVRHKLGFWCYFEAVATSLLDDPAVAGVVVNCHDITQRKQIEAALRRANRRIVNILESITDAFISVDSDWQLTYVNQQAAQIVQKTPEELLGRTLWQVFPETIGSTFERAYRQAWEQQTPTTFEEFYQPLNTWFEVRVFPSPEGLSIFFLDVTERRQAQSELLEMSTALGNAVEGIARLDVQGHYVALNRAYAASLGYQPEEMIGLSWRKTIYPEDLGLLETAYQQMLAEGKAEVEVRGLCKDGSCFYLQIVLVTASDWCDRLIGFHCFTKDITERKRAEAALRESEKRLNLTLEATQMGVWNYDLETGQVTWSESCEQLFGLQPGSYQGRVEDFFACIHPEDLALVQQAVQLQLRQELDRKEFRILRPDGSVRWILERSCTLLHDSRLRPVVMGISMDITDRKWSEEVLQQQTERERLMATIASRIRQSLDLETILKTTVSEVRQFLKANRVIIFRIASDESGTVIAESVEPQWRSVQGSLIQDAWFRQRLPNYRQGRNFVIDDTRSINQGGLCPPALQSWEVKSLLVVPILHGEQLWGLLAAHQCTLPRHWESVEISLLEQLATQVAIAIQQSELYRQVQQLNTELESQVQERTAQLQQALAFEAMLKRITDAVRDSLDEAEILQTAVQELVLGLGVKGCDAALHNLEQQTSVICYEYLQPEVPARHGTTIVMADFQEIYDQLFQGWHFQFCRLTADMVRLLDQPFSLLACPMVNDQGVMGDLWLFKPRDQAFSNQEIRLVQQVANHCAIAVRQARLYQAAQVQVQTLEGLNRLKDEFLSTVSHELRTPMSNMKMAIHMLQTRPDSDRREQYLEILRLECQRETELINDLLDLQRLEASAYPVLPAVVDLAVCLKTIIEPFQARMKARNQIFELQLGALSHFRTDQKVLERIVAELLNNACKYTPPAGQIEFAANLQASGLVEILIRNQAEIPGEELPRVFEKFYRIPNADPWRQGGTGLGLALVRQLVEQLNSTLQVESRLGWTSFTLWLEPLG